MYQDPETTKSKETNVFNQIQPLYVAQIIQLCDDKAQFNFCLSQASLHGYVWKKHLSRSSKQ